ncbi:MAG: hypothetical protein Q4G71_14945 [Pseudomonadota bacterium]|nr:hypothetical protein [Pseudomonadota bacterium]
MNTRKQARLTRHTGQLARAVPQVVALRLARMWWAGPMPNARDQQEMYRMGAEKVAAFSESWLAMSAQTVAAQQQFAMWWGQTWWKVAMGGWMNPPSLGHLSSSAQQRVFGSMLDTAMRGMAPVHRRAVANARRLTRNTG